ncbi:MAG: carbohydrate ABC transporter permease [Clostridiales bacterium]|nr:carbohydrate ABC transporter permease [Clostridiales bacterium]
MQRSITTPPSAEAERGAGRTRRLTKERVKKLLLGTRDRNGIIKLVVVYGLLICIGFIYLYPILYMISASFMTLDDLLDSSIRWIPSGLNLSNYRQAGTSMVYWNSLLQSVMIAGLPTLGTLASCALTGYGLARYRFRGRGGIIALIILTFVLPSQITMIPTYTMYSNLGILNSLWAFVVPSLVAQGLNAPIFILIFWQFFRNVPPALVEAAKIDGAGHFKAFFSIALPTAGPAFITVALFSFVWYWNEFYLTQLFVHGVLVESSLTTLIIQLQNFATNYSSYAQTAASGATNLNESIKMAGTLIAVLPLLILYFVLQRHFVESIDRTGITGE